MHTIIDVLKISAIIGAFPAFALVCAIIGNYLARGDE